MRHHQENTQLKSRIQIHSFESSDMINTFSDREAFKRENVEILWSKYGSGTVQADGKIMQVEEHQIYCFLPGQLRKFQLEGPVNGYYIS